ncbi:hypothetical protein [Cellulosimicrobium sp. Marseille-Q4280]|uniref:hypothetical protein n=1 Tax=Cellulosimicrobium sp. Marseille-Q4280 TaxID=2937992 RepID=UPI0020402AF0|nr:hypothetical protein [Cellulosimicrobium sp. Marseille-Q4280]
MSTTRLTSAQVEALERVADGRVTSEDTGERRVWRVRGFWQPAPARPYERLLADGLIEAQFEIYPTPVTVTDTGREALS